MEDQNPSENEPQDTIPNQNQITQENQTEQISTEANQKMLEEEKNETRNEESEKKMKEEEMNIKEALDQKSLAIINFSNELETLLLSIQTIWENNNEGFVKYYTEEVKPKFNEYLSYPSITAYREKVIQIFGFLCKYFLNRKNFLKIISRDEIYTMLNIIYGQNYNIFSINPNTGGIQEYEFIEDKYFYHVFKELLPNKEVQNSYSLNDKNCCYKYFLEFIFQCGFVEDYLCDYLHRIDLTPLDFSAICYFPANLLHLCDKDFVKEKKWSFMSIRLINTRVNFFLSENNPYIKDDGMMNQLLFYMSTYYMLAAFGIFNHVFDDLIANYLKDCQMFAITVFRLNEHFLKSQKINIRMIGMQNISNLCDNYLKFGKKTDDYREYCRKYNDAEKICGFLVKCGIEYLAQMKIFDIIFGENIHEGLIQRSYTILSLLYKNKLFDSSHIQILWNLSQTKYKSIADDIISLFGNLLPEFSLEDCNSILNIVDKMPLKEVDDITLKLLENFFKGNIRLELLLNILFKFSNELSYEQGLDKNIINKSRQILIRLLMNKNYTQDLFKYIKKCIFHIHRFYLVDTYFSTLRHILNYLANPENKNIYNNFKFEIEIKNFDMLIAYLDNKYKLFPIHMNYLIKIIQLFGLFYHVSTTVINELNQGNFEYDKLFNLDSIYSEYIVFKENNLTFSYNLSSETTNTNNNENGMDIDAVINTSVQSNKQVYCLENELGKEINDQEQAQYVKNLIKNYVQYFQEIIKSTNTVPSQQDLIIIIFHQLKIGFQKLNYTQYIDDIMASLFLNHLRSNSKLKLTYLNFLFNIAQSTKNIDPQLQWYFHFICETFKARIAQNHVNLLDEDTMRNIIHIQIQNSNISTMPISAFNTLLIYVIYINQKISNAVYSPLIHKFTEIKNISNFWGFDLFWQFYNNSLINEVSNAAYDTIINIFELVSKKDEDRNKLINRIFEILSKQKSQINSNPQIKISFIRSLKVISVILGKKINKDIFGNKQIVNGGNSTIEVQVLNHFFDFKDQQVYKIHISNEQTIKNLKEFIINNIICSQTNLDLYNKHVQINNEKILNEQNNINTNRIVSEEEEKMNIEGQALKSTLTLEQLLKMVYDTNIIITYKNTVLKNEFTVADYHIEENDKLLIFNAGGHNEEVEYVPSESVLQEGYIGIKSIFGDQLYFGEDVMKAAIIKYKGNIEEAGLYLTVPQNVQILQKEIENKKSKLEQNHDDIICLDEEKINLMIEVLSSNNDQDINNQIWELFSSIKYPETVINAIFGEDLNKILMINNVNKLILYLEIIDSLIFGGDFCKYNKLNIEQKSAWISNFIKNEELIKKIFTVLNKLDTKIGIINLYKIIKIFVGWFHKILFKICEINENAANIIPEINMFRSLNEHDNIQNKNNNNNANNNNSNEKENDKQDDEFKIINDQSNINFLNTLSEIQAVLILYNILNLLSKLNLNEEKIILLPKIFEFILMGLMLQKNNIPNFCELEKNHQVLEKIIIYSKNHLEKKIVKNFLKVLVRDLMPLTDPKDLITGNNIFNIILQSFINDLLSGAYFNREFCDIFSHLLVFTTNDIITKQIEPLIYKFLDDIYHLSSNIDKCDEKQRNILRYDTYVINGCLKYYQKIILNYINITHSQKKMDYIEFLYDFLFLIEKNKNTKKINSSKFKDNFIRNNLYHLLTELISFDNNYLLRILPKVITHHKKLEIFDPNEIETPFDVNIRSSDEKLVGLRNFGSTCYLNSLTQQLFMMPCFRKDLFNNFNIGQNPTDRDPEKLRYSVLYNLQLTFESLIYGSMSPYPPKRFVRSFLSAFNGEPIQFGIQQDSDEFLSILCDNLEKEAKGFEKENFLENSFKGKISNEILSLEKEYPYYSQSEEPFFRITLDIKGHKSLEEALDAYVKGEILDGDNKYYVDEHKRKISIRKSSSLKLLGNEVIIHLKRFEFDFVTFNNYKLSDYLKFPTKINFKKWTRAYLRLNDNPNNKLNEDLLKITDEEKKNLIDDNMDYILTGILVHGGSNLQSGHYYSYIMDQETGKWHQFNDNTISDYDIEKELENECFGNHGGNNINQYGKTAYLLFYTKKSIFRNKNLFENITINDLVANDVYNENMKFLNMNIYLNVNYFRFLKQICSIGIPLVNDENQINKENNLTLSNDLIKNGYIYQKVLSVLKPEDEGDSVDENIEEENGNIDITNKPNFEQVYNKCKEEIETILKQEKEENKKVNNFICKRKLIKLYFNYVFGIILPHFNLQNPANQNQQLVMNAFQGLIEIIKENPGYSLWILKQIEKNISLFTDILFRYGTTENELNDMAKLILEFFQTTFDIIYHYEKETMDITTDMITYFIKNNEGKFIIMKEYRSIVMRLVKKLFCDNLERSRFEYARSSLYLIIFYNFVKSYPEIASITVNYFFTLISLITNNTLTTIKSEVNPNYLMGNNADYSVNIQYISIFCDTLLRCVTPGMKNSNTYSPFFSNKKKAFKDNYLIDWSQYPSLPQNWEKILSIEFYVKIILFHPYSKSKEITCHLSYCDEEVSVKILKLVCEFSKSKYFIHFIEKIFNNALCVFDLKDNLELIRVDALFELSDKNNEEPIDLEQNKSLFKYLEEEKENSMKLVLVMLYNVGAAIEKYDVIRKYFEINRNKLGWIAKFINMIRIDQITKDKFARECGYILNQHPDLLKVIQESIIKRFNLE